MKLLFAGSSLYAHAVDLSGLVVRPFAVQGDIANAVHAGATAIGLVDGSFELTASVWHKEILYAISNGVTMLGASSMGALRASECAAFGMIPVGRIAEAYAAGLIDDDASVALEFGPAELGNPPLTEALIDAEATIEQLGQLGLIDPPTVAALTDRARALFFKDRTARSIVEGQADAAALLLLYVQHRRSQKALDAIELVHRIKALPDVRRDPQAGWAFHGSPFWDRALASSQQRFAAVAAE